MRKTWWLLLVMVVVAVGVSPAEDIEADDIRVLKRASKAFSAVAKKGMPGVVFIQVEKTIEAQAPAGYGQYNDPHGFFGDDFFNRFFRERGQDMPPRQYRQTGQGSGFIISKDGYILTNNHVVGDADKITVKLHDGREFEATRVGTDPKTEVAVIKIEGQDLPGLELGDSDKLEIGEWVIAIGNPFGLSETVTVGVVSATGRSNIGIAEYEDFIQTDAAINPGNSGGPLLNIDGQVVGINTAIYSQSGGYMGIGFAVPANMARAIKDQLVRNGKVVRGFLGVRLNPQEIDEDLAAEFGLKDTCGILVAEVLDDSPAKAAGVRSGDVIVEVNGAPVTDNSSFRNTIAMIGPETKVKLGVVRDGKRTNLDAVIGTLPGDRDEKEAVLASEMAERIGLAVRDLSAELARRFGYDFDEGVIVAQVMPGSAAAQAEIQPGFLILSVNRNPVNNAKVFYEELGKSAQTGRVLLRVKNPNYSWYVLLRLD